MREVPESTAQRRLATESEPLERAGAPGDGVDFDGVEGEVGVGDEQGGDDGGVGEFVGGVDARVREVGDAADGEGPAVAGLGEVAGQDEGEHGGRVFVVAEELGEDGIVGDAGVGSVLGRVGAGEGGG